MAIYCLLSDQETDPLRKSSKKNSICARKLMISYQPIWCPFIYFRKNLNYNICFVPRPPPPPQFIALGNKSEIHHALLSELYLLDEFFNWKSVSQILANVLFVELIRNFMTKTEY